LTGPEALTYDLGMAHLNAIAAISIVRFWWPGRSVAARWRD
jgi:hypothetical protein